MPQPERSRSPGQRWSGPLHRALSRRSALKLVGGLAAGMLAACRVDPAPAPTQPADAPGTMTPTPRPAGRNGTPVATPAATPTPTPPETARPLVHGLYLRDPVSHDFNADLDAGGEPSLWSGLLTLDASYNVTADWAETWQPNADATRWTFSLRRNISGWSNGDPVTAHDFVWSWRRLVAPETAAPHAWLLFDVVNAQEIHEGSRPPDALGVLALDDRTLAVDLRQPARHFPAIAASIGTVPAHRPTVERYGDRWTEAEHCVSNGPRRLRRWERGSVIDLEWNPHHWNAAFSSSDVIAPIADEDQQLARYGAGERYVVPVPAGALDRVRLDPGLMDQLEAAIDPVTWFFIPNARLAPFDDARMRRAVAHAIDKERIVQITEGRVRAAHCLIPPGLPGHGNDRETRALQRFDVDQSIAELRDTVIGETGEWPPVRLLLPAGDELARVVCEDIARQLLENLRLDIPLDEREEPAYRQALEAGDYDLAWWSWRFTYADPQNGYADAFGMGHAPAPEYPWSATSVEALIDRARGEPDASIRRAAYRECERILQQEAAYLPIAHPISFYLIRPEVRGIPADPAGSVLLPDQLIARASVAPYRIEPPI